MSYVYICEEAWEKGPIALIKEFEKFEVKVQ